MELGDRYTSKSFGHTLEVIELLPYPFVKVRFIITDRVVILRRSNVRSLQFRDQYQPTLYGIGIVGGIQVRVNGKLLPSYVAWTSMLERCDKRGNIKDQVCEEWFYFENFKSWYDHNVPEGWVVDKDYKKIGNYIYSPETCTPLPCELNSLLTRTLTAKGYTLTSSGKYDVRIRVEGNSIIRKYFDDKGKAYKFYVDEKRKYINRLRIKYLNSVPDYVFDNAVTMLHEAYLNNRQ